MDLFWTLVTLLLLVMLAAVLAIGAYHLEQAQEKERECEAQRRIQAQSVKQLDAGYSRRELSAISGRLLREDATMR